MIIVIALLAIIILAIIITISMHYVVTSQKPEDERVKYNNQLFVLLESCKNECSDENIARRISGIIETIRYSDANSPNTAREAELRLQNKVFELYKNIQNKKTVDANENLNEIEKLIKERSIMTKYNK